MKKSFGDYLRSVREQNNMPIRKLAAVLDIDQSTLSKIERGERLPKEDMIPKVAKHFQISIDELNEAYLTDKVLIPIRGKQNPEKILAAAQEKLRYLKSKSYRQSKLNI